MVKLLFLTILLVLSLTCLSQSNVTIKGTITHSTNELELENMSEKKSFLLANEIFRAIPRKSNRIIFKFPLTQAGYFRIGRNQLYISPGDQSEFTIDYDDPSKASFIGSNVQINTYLKTTPFPKAGSFIYAGKNIKSTLDSTQKFILQAGNERIELLESLSITDTKIIKQEFIRIQADILNSIYQIPTYFSWKHNLSDPQSDSIKLLNDLFLVNYLKDSAKLPLNDKYLALESYRDIVELILPYRNISQHYLKVIDWINANTIAHDLKNADSLSNLNAIKQRINRLLSKDYKKRLTSILNNQILYGDGKLATNFLFMNENGQLQKLSDFKGNYIYIDLWATWCSPCIENLQHFDSIRLRYPKLVILILSIDEDKKSWNLALKKLKLFGFQGMVDRAKLAKYMIGSIPRAILINPDFTVNKLKAPLMGTKNFDLLMESIDINMR